MSLMRPYRSYYLMENECEKTIKKVGKVTNLEWEIIRGTDRRPIRIEVTADVNGVTKPYIH